MNGKKIKSILESNTTGQIYSVQGWVRTFRANRFIALNDGSTIENLQCIVDFEKLDESVLKQITTGAALRLIGTLLVSKGSGQSVELNSDQYSLLEMSSGKQFKYYIEELANHPAYISAPPKEKQIYLRDVRKASNEYGKEMVKIVHGNELLKEGILSYYKERRDTPYYEYLPDFLRKGYDDRFKTD